jgi:hypothetical protein
MTGLVVARHGYYRTMFCPCGAKMVVPRAGPYSPTHLVTYTPKQPSLMRLSYFVALTTHMA